MSSYIHFTEEQKQRAAAVDLEEFLRCRGEKLLSSGREKRLASDHSVTVRGNEWYDHAEERGGHAVSFVQRFYGLSYPDAVTLAQLEKNYGKEGSEIIQDNCQDTIFGGFAPNSQTAEVLSKALGNRTVLSGSVSRGKNDPSQSLQMMERPLLTPDELKSIPKGNFIVQKTGQHPMRTRLRLFLEWGITFEKPYIVPERADRAVAYANREDLERNLPQSNKAENADMRGAYAVSGRGGIAHEPAVDKPRRRGGKQMKTYGEEDL